MNKIDSHFNKCRDLWCELWEREGRITKAGEKNAVSSVLEALNSYIRDEHDAIEQWKTPAVSRCRLHLLGEAAADEGQSPRWSAATPSPWKERVALARANGKAASPLLPYDGSPTEAGLERDVIYQAMIRLELKLDWLQARAVGAEPVVDWPRSPYPSREGFSVQFKAARLAEGGER